MTPWEGKVRRFVEGKTFSGSTLTPGTGAGNLVPFGWCSGISPDLFSFYLDDERGTKRRSLADEFALRCSSKGTEIPDR